LRVLLARLHAHHGRLDPASLGLEAIREQLAALPRGDNWLFFAVVAAEVSAIARDREQGAWLFEALLPYADRGVLGGMMLCMGQVTRPLGSLAALLGRRDESEAHFASALAYARALRSPVMVAMVQIDHAEALAAHGSPADALRCSALLRSVLSAADRFGLGGLRERVQAVAMAQKRPGALAG
jgi:hypothetical protein